MSSPKPTLLTPGEYLEIERKAEIRSEYTAGRIYAMAGASRRHNLIAENILTARGWTSSRTRPAGRVAPHAASWTRLP